jgi:hypothetical protein
MFNAEGFVDDVYFGRTKTARYSTFNRQTSLKDNESHEVWDKEARVANNSKPLSDGRKSSEQTGFGGFYLLILFWLWRNVTTWTSLGAYRSHVSSIQLWYSYGCQIFWVNVLPYSNLPVCFIWVLNSVSYSKGRTWTDVRKSDTKENVRTSEGGDYNKLVIIT